MSRIARTALAIDADLLERFDRWMGRHGYTNRSQALRDLIRQALLEAEGADPAARLVATISIIYEHHGRELSRQLANVQHEDFRTILCSQHVHLDAHRCLEVIIMAGPARRLRKIADAIAATRGVLAGKLTLLSPELT